MKHKCIRNCCLVCFFQFFESDIQCFIAISDSVFHCNYFLPLLFYVFIHAVFLLICQQRRVEFLSKTFRKKFGVIVVFYYRLYLFRIRFDNFSFKEVYNYSRSVLVHLQHHGENGCLGVTHPFKINLFVSPPEKEKH